MMRLLFIVTVVAAVLMSSAWATRFGALAATQRSATQGSTPSQPSQSMQDMMKMHEQMMAQMKAGDAKLDALVKDMDAARGEAKVSAVAAVVAELVRQNRSMHDQMGQMHMQMMGGRGMMMNR